MKRTSILLICLPFLLASCSPALKSSKIVYNSKKQTFEYQAAKNSSIPLRNKDLSLVDESSIDSFRKELAKYKYEYPAGSRSENTFILQRNDLDIASKYRDANIYIKKKDYASAIENLNNLLQLYPDIYKYSDFSFLMGYCFDRLQQTDSAAHFYNEFLKYSSKKYSARFHGYASGDKNQESYIWMRNLARQRLTGEAGNERYIPVPITPKYYYASFQPGYSFNKTENDDNIKGSIMFMIGQSVLNQTTWGIQSNFYLTDFVNVSPGISYSREVWEASLALPMQIYKSKNNRVGIKITPYFETRFVKANSTNEFWNTFGGRASAGFYVMPKLSLGAYYQYNYHNENNPFQSNGTNEYFHHNEYDVSVFYNLSKAISVKAGVKNNDILAGFYLSGWEISYNFTSPGLVLRTKMY